MRNKNNKYRDRKEQQQRELKRRELQNKITRSRDAIQYYGQNSANDLDNLPSEELRFGLLAEILESYPPAMMQSSLRTSNLDELTLFDPWESRQVILAESRPVQDRILGLLATSIQMLTHIEEECTLFNNNRDCEQGSGSALRSKYRTKAHGVFVLRNYGDRACS